MQILPATAHFLAQRSGATTFTTADLATPQVNIAYGSYYLRYLLERVPTATRCWRWRPTTAARRTSTAGWPRRATHGQPFTVDADPVPGDARLRLNVAAPSR